MNRFSFTASLQLIINLSSRAEFCIIEFHSNALPVFLNLTKAAQKTTFWSYSQTAFSSLHSISNIFTLLCWYLRAFVFCNRISLLVDQNLIGTFAVTCNLISYNMKTLRFLLGLKTVFIPFDLISYSWEYFLVVTPWLGTLRPWVQMGVFD